MSSAFYFKLAIDPESGSADVQLQTADTLAELPKLDDLEETEEDIPLDENARFLPKHRPIRSWPFSYEVAWVRLSLDKALAGEELERPAHERLLELGLITADGKPTVEAYQVIHLPDPEGTIALLIR